MRKTRVRGLGFASFLLVTSFSEAHADASACPLDPVHCAYFTGLSDSLDGGRYIKLTNGTVGSIVLCFNASSSVSLGQQGAGNHLEANSDTYSICSDASGRSCETVAVDNFFVSQSENGFVAKPQFFNVSLSAFKNRYPSCNSVLKHLNRDLFPKKG